MDLSTGTQLANLLSLYTSLYRTIW